MVRLGMIVDEGGVGARSGSILIYESMFGGDHATSMEGVWVSARVKTTLSEVDESQNLKDEDVKK